MHKFAHPKAITLQIKIFVLFFLWFVNKSKLKSHSCLTAASQTERSLFCQYLPLMCFVIVSKSRYWFIVLSCSILVFNACNFTCRIEIPTKNNRGQWNEDEDEEPRCVQLTNQHKGAIRFIRKVNCHHNSRKFSSRHVSFYKRHQIEGKWYLNRWVSSIFSFQDFSSICVSSSFFFWFLLMPISFEFSFLYFIHGLTINFLNLRKFFIDPTGPS